MRAAGARVSGERQEFLRIPLGGSKTERLVYDLGEDEAFLLMEYVAGGTLASRLERVPLRIEEDEGARTERGCPTRSRHSRASAPCRMAAMRPSRTSAPPCTSTRLGAL
jgi:hypothetical protein